MQNESNSSKNPFGRLALGLETKSPNVGGASFSSLVHRAIIEVLQFLLTLRRWGEEEKLTLASCVTALMNMTGIAG